MHYVIGTRGSQLALVQTNYVKERLEQAYPQDSFEIKIIKTLGDRNQQAGLDQLGAKGVFTTEIEDQLLANEIQLAVHSMKDMPEETAQGLTFAKAWKREDPRDVLILKDKASLDDLPQNAVIGTGSKRRAFQLKELRSDITTIGIRGNVDTRIRKLFESDMDGIVLAAAGMKRLGREKEISCFLAPDQMIPAPAQGILALETRAEDLELLEKINALSDQETELAAKLERGFLKAMGGDCHLPIGAYYGDGIFYAIFGNEDGSRLAKAKRECALSGLSNEEREKKIAEVLREITEEIQTQLRD